MARKGRETIQRTAKALLSVKATHAQESDMQQIHVICLITVKARGVVWERGRKREDWELIT